MGYMSVSFEINSPNHLRLSPIGFIHRKTSAMMEIFFVFLKLIAFPSRITNGVNSGNLKSYFSLRICLTFSPKMP